MVPKVNWEADWEAQWALHCPHYKEGHLVLDLQEFDFPLKLIPGPGFGDLSHPTTRLVLQNLVPQALGRTILDIGSGSGILALAAAKAGAKAVYACDIDPDALAHGQQNGALNDLAVVWTLPEKVPLLERGTVAVMNMIRSEQELAWGSLRKNHSYITTWITSGVLEEEREVYLREVERRGWVLQEEWEEAGWMAFQFGGVSHFY